MIEEDDDTGPIFIREGMCPPLDKARKHIDYGTENAYDPENNDHISEWAMAMAVANYNVGQEVPFEEFHKQVVLCKQEQMLIDLVERGIMEAYWDGQGTAYRVTPKGIRAHAEYKQRKA
jgi:hypothetical protein